MSPSTRHRLRVWWRYEDPYIKGIAALLVLAAVTYLLKYH